MGWQEKGKGILSRQAPTLVGADTGQAQPR